MQRAIHPDWLLRQADELGYRDAGAGQPRNTNLRRAVASAYYAVFHGLVLAATDHLLPGGTAEERQRLARSFTRANVRLACECVVTPNNPPTEARPIAVAAGGNAALVDVAEALLSLQEARHLADYDHRVRPPASSKAGVYRRRSVRAWLPPSRSTTSCLSSPI